MLIWSKGKDFRGGMPINDAWEHIETLYREWDSV